MCMNKASKILVISFFICMVISGIAIYYRTIVLNDYIIVSEHDS